MASKPISGSPNITLLGVKLVADLCQGKVFFDLSPSLFINATAILGAKIKVIDTFGQELKPYGTAYDFLPPFTSIYQIDVPKRGGEYIYGNYSAEVELTDSGGEKYVVSTGIDICEVGGDACVGISSDCANGKLLVNLASVPTYKGVSESARVQSVVVKFPTGSLAQSSPFGDKIFSVQLYTGVYNIVGNICSEYNLGEDVFVKVPYSINEEKKVLCGISDACFFSGMEAKYQQLKTCNVSDRDKISKDLFLLLINKARYDSAISAGEDPEEIIQTIETILGFDCRCGLTDGVAVIPGSPSSDFVITGVNIPPPTVSGLTTTYDIPNWEYGIDLLGGDNIMSLAPINTTATKKITPIVFSAINMYNSVKGYAGANPSDWGAIIKAALSGLDASCLGLTDVQYNAMTFFDFIQFWVRKMCNSSSCGGTVSNVVPSRSGADVVIAFSATGCSTVKIFIDGVFVSEVLASSISVRLNGYSNGVEHSYAIYPVCSNGALGVPVTGTFNFFSCPTINTPNLTSTNAVNVTCPFNLNSLLGALPPGITVEWHNLNNTLSSSLVPSPTSVVSGTYFAFAKDTGGCYSASVAVQVTCASGGNLVTAPQNITVQRITSGNELISFQSAAFPPLNNSYIVQRRLFSDPDIPASYTQVGVTPTSITFNSSTGRYETIDVGGVSNVLYIYRAISDQAGSGNPYIDTQYADISCVSALVNSTLNSVSYSFTPIGGSVNKYEVELYDNAGVNRIAINTVLPPFSNPITGSFTGLTSGTGYKVRITPFIGAFKKTGCGDVSVSTQSSAPSNVTLQFSGYAGGKFTFGLSAAIPSTNIVIEEASVNAYSNNTCGGASYASDQVPTGANPTILAGSTIVIYESLNPIIPTVNSHYKRVNSITVNGNVLTNGGTFLVGTTTVTVSIPNTCDPLEA